MGCRLEILSPGNNCVPDNNNIILLQKHFPTNLPSIDIRTIGTSEIGKGEVSVIMLYHLTMMSAHFRVIDTHFVFRASPYCNDFHKTVNFILNIKCNNRLAKAYHVATPKRALLEELAVHNNALCIGLASVYDFKRSPVEADFRMKT